MIRLGITGGIGSGKSVVGKVLEVMGVPVYYTDAEAKRIETEDEEVRREIVGVLGEEAYNGRELNKKYIAQRIFGDAELLGRVNAIVHPAVAKDFERWAEAQGGEIVAVESAILYECGMDKVVERVCLVCAPVETRIERAMRRDGAERESIAQRVRAQNADEERYRDMADYAIENGEGGEGVIAQVRRIVRDLKD